MRVKKSTLGLIVFILLLLLFLLLIFLPISYFQWDSEVLCASDRIASPCGIITSSGKTVFISSVLKRKYKKNNKYYFEAVTSDSKKKSVIFSFTTPANLQKIILNITSQEGRKLFGEAPVASIEVKKFYEIVPLQSKINIPIYVPDATDIKKAKKLGVNEDILRCVDYYHQLISYLKNPTLLNKAQLEITKSVNKCSLMIGALSI